VPFSTPERMDYDGLPTYIKSKLVYLRPGLRRFLERALALWWIVIWSSMKWETTHAVVEFLFKGIEFPCMVLGQESCRTLWTPEGTVVKKQGKPQVNQFLKVLKPILWDQRPAMIGCPYDLRPARANTLMVDDTPSKNILNPNSNYVVCPTWTVGKVHDRFLIDLGLYLEALVRSRLSVPEFIQSNPIGDNYLDPRSYLYRELYNHAKFNKLI